MRRVGSCLRHVSVFGLLLGACLLPRSSARADEEREAAWLSSGAFTRAGAVEIAGRAYPVWVNAESEGTGNAWLVVLFPGFDEPESACDVYRRASEGEDTVYSVRRRTDREDETSDLVEYFGLAPEVEAIDVARTVVNGLLDVEDRWNAAARTLGEAAETSDDDAARLHALQATRALERLHAQEPWHYGVVRDLLAAYQLLLPYEVGTDRGANVSFLWRPLLEDWQRGAVSTEDWRVALLGHLNLVFAEGCYAQVGAMLTEFGASDDPLAAPLFDALARLGQRDSLEVLRETVDGAHGSVVLATLATAGEPPEGVPLFHRRTWLLYDVNGSDIPLPVWFSLAREAPREAGGDARWGLFGWVGGSRRLLSLYGAAPPETESLDAVVRGLVKQTADGQGARR
jgi:hypothetical protein